MRDVFPAATSPPTVPPCFSQTGHALGVTGTRFGALPLYSEPFRMWDFLVLDLIPVESCHLGGVL